MQTSVTWTAVKVWVYTVFFNGLLIGLAVCWNGGIYGVLAGLLFLFFGCAVGLPFLALVIPVINLSKKLPYSNKSKIAWIGYWLAVLIVAFYTLVDWLFTGRFFSYTIDVFKISSVTILALVLSLMINRKALLRLHEAADERDFNQIIN